jgi:hypothetical protein
MTACTFLFSSPQHHVSLSSNQKHSNQPYKVLQPDFLFTLGLPVTPTPGNASPRRVSGEQAPYVVLLSPMYEFIVFAGSELPVPGVAATPCAAPSRVVPTGPEQGILIAMDSRAFQTPQPWPHCCFRSCAFSHNLSLEPYAALFAGQSHMQKWLSKLQGDTHQQVVLDSLKQEARDCLRTLKDRNASASQKQAAQNRLRDIQARLQLLSAGRPASRQ